MILEVPVQFLKETTGLNPGNDILRGLASAGPLFVYGGERH